MTPWFGENATSIGAFSSGHPFDDPDILWRCNECTGLFVSPDGIMRVVGMVALESTGGPFSAQWWEKEGARQRANLVLATTYRDSEKCGCRESEDGQGYWEAIQKEYDEFLVSRARWQITIDLWFKDDDD